MWGLSPQDNNTQINNYKTSYGITNPCAGTQGGGPEAIDVVIAGQNFLGYPTYCIVCPDRTLYFDVCWPPTATCFDPYIESCVPPLAANFSANVDQGCAGLTVFFSDQSAGNPTSWNWTFEGGDPPASTFQNPVVVYNSAGEFDVTLEVTAGSASNTKTEDNFINVFALPDVTFEPLDTACLEWPPFELIGGAPEGGDYSGPGVTDNIFDPATAGTGTHTIIYTYEDENGCENSASQDIVVDVCAGLKGNHNNAFKIYPNPSDGMFNISIKHQGQISITVYNLLGGVVLEQSAIINGNDMILLNLEDIPGGLYILALKTDSESFVEKIRIVR